MCCCLASLPVASITYDALNCYTLALYKLFFFSSTFPDYFPSLAFNSSLEIPVLNSANPFSERFLHRITLDEIWPFPADTVFLPLSRENIYLFKPFIIQDKSEDVVFDTYYCFHINSHPPGYKKSIFSIMSSVLD